MRQSTILLPGLALQFWRRHSGNQNIADTAGLTGNIQELVRLQRTNTHTHAHAEVSTPKHVRSQELVQLQGTNTHTHVHTGLGCPTFPDFF
ncbi:hypothetical protein P7K49_009119 [Saguinus oedipus]|uniref:Secreted protein n=1 Tax=Saguinus oedipus TaxID=9490 RepID=A0ABQ9VZQ9_SAGOE|nr:hypothetical protein P7K49_009119 [Saguinus oedipus]